MTKKNVKLSNLSPAQRGFPSLVKRERKPIADIVAYSMMPNHVHIIARERAPGGISKFMLKLMTGYSMYFNTKYERSGPLFTRPFRSRHVDTDAYLRRVFAYVTLNPLELFDAQWKATGIADKTRALQFMRDYRYASFVDYFGGTRLESAITDKTALQSVATFEDIDCLLKELSNTAYEEISFTSGGAPSLV